ncbi:DsbA family protein [Pseudoxanthomonas wuyuanensis]
MPVARLHYIYDPLCGWCYAAAPLVEAAASIPGLTIELHAGGMLSGANRRRIDPQWREYVIPHDRRIAQLSGQPFGSGYFDGLLRDGSAVLDSSPPITAVLVAEALAGRGHDLLRRVQCAHFVEGQQIANASVLQSLAAEIGLAPAAFAELFQQLAGDPTSRHIAESRTLLAETGGHGFPTFALLQAGRSWQTLDTGPYLDRAAAWKAYLTDQLSRLRCHGT